MAGRFERDMAANAAKRKAGVVRPTKKGQKAIRFRPGGLHESTGTPQGQKIPASKRRAALGGRYGPKAKKQAQFAANVLTGPK